MVDPEMNKNGDTDNVKSISFSYSDRRGMAYVIIGATSDVSHDTMPLRKLLMNLEIISISTE